MPLATLIGVVWVLNDQGSYASLVVEALRLSLRSLVQRRQFRVICLCKLLGDTSWSARLMRLLNQRLSCNYSWLSVVCFPIVPVDVCAPEDIIVVNSCTHQILVIHFLEPILVMPLDIFGLHYVWSVSRFWSNDGNIITKNIAYLSSGIWTRSIKHHARVYGRVVLVTNTKFVIFILGNLTNLGYSCFISWSRLGYISEGSPRKFLRLFLIRIKRFRLSLILVLVLVLRSQRHLVRANLFHGGFSTTHCLILLILIYVLLGMNIITIGLGWHSLYDSCLHFWGFYCTSFVWRLLITKRCILGCSLTFLGALLDGHFVRVFRVVSMVFATLLVLNVFIHPLD